MGCQPGQGGLKAEGVHRASGSASKNPLHGAGNVAS